MSDHAFEANVALRLALMERGEVTALLDLIGRCSDVMRDVTIEGHPALPDAEFDELARFIRQTLVAGTFAGLSSAEWLALLENEHPEGPLVLRGLLTTAEKFTSTSSIESPDAPELIVRLLGKLGQIIDSMHLPHPASERGWQWADFNAGWATGSANAEYDLPSVLRAVNEPGGQWLPPLDTVGSGEPRPHLTYWFALSVVVLAHLGWANPIRGITTWINRGMPDDGAVLTSVKRLFGAEVAALILNDNVAAVADLLTPKALGVAGDDRLLASQLRQQCLGDPVCELAIRQKERWSVLLLGGLDALHLKPHLIAMLKHPETGVAGKTLSRESGSGVRAHLHVDHSYGWYEALSGSEAQLPVRHDGRSWRVRVTAGDLGYLGEFRRSRKTGRWFSGKHSSHMLGN